MPPAAGRALGLGGRKAQSPLERDGQGKPRWSAAAASSCGSPSADRGLEAVWGLGAVWVLGAAWAASASAACVVTPNVTPKERSVPHPAW